MKAGVWIELLVGVMRGEVMEATARCSQLTLATRNSRDFPLTLGGVLHPYAL